jgi:chaperonin GroES
MIKLTPLKDRVLLKYVPKVEEKKTIIMLSDDKKSDEVEVVALGTGKRDENGNMIPFKVNVGDRVILEKYSSQEIEFEGEKYLIVREENIIGVLE